MTSENDLVGALDIAVETARIWEQRGDANWAARSYVQAVLASLRVAVKRPDVEAGKSFLRERGINRLLRRALDYTRVLANEILAGDVPPSVIGGNYHLSVLAHVGWLIGDDCSARAALGVANISGICHLSPAFWTEYAHALHLLDQGASYEVAKRSWKREESWAPYLRLVADASQGADPGASLSAVEAAFNKRNNDRRFAGDQYGIEGSGREPASWDYRVASLLALSARRR